MEVRARSRQHPATAQTHERKKAAWVRGVVCCGTQTHTMTVVA